MSADQPRAQPSALWPSVLAVIALILSIVAFFFSQRADVVELGRLTGTPQLDAYRAQVEELQRANDRILNTAWAALGIVVTLATVLVTFNFIRGDRVIEGERRVIEERFQAAVGRRHDELQTAVTDEEKARKLLEGELRDSLRQAEQRTDELQAALLDERKKRAELGFQLVQFQQDVLRLAQDITGASGPFLPFYYTRVWGPLPTSVGLLNSAMESDREPMIISALHQLGNAVDGPIPHTDIAWLDEIIGKVEAVPKSYNPLRDQVLAKLHARLEDQRRYDRATKEEPPR